jgi:hypothetical protein
VLILEAPDARGFLFTLYIGGTERAAPALVSWSRRTCSVLAKAPARRVPVAGRGDLDDPVLVAVQMPAQLLDCALA